MRKAMMHLAQFLCHSPTYHSLAMWRHPRTAAAGYDWSRPELYQHIARVCERGRFDMVFFADLNYISDTFTGSLAPALRRADPISRIRTIRLRSPVAKPPGLLPRKGRHGDRRPADLRGSR